MTYEQGGRENLTVNYTGTQLKTFSHTIAATDLIAIIQFHNSYASKQGGRRHWTKIYTGTQSLITVLSYSILLVLTSWYKNFRG